MTEKVFVAGHGGLVGSAVVRTLTKEGIDLITAPRSELDLLDQARVRAFLDRTSPDVVILAAARVGGIHANRSRPWDFIHENLVIQDNVMGAAMEVGVKRLTFLGSSCIYPRLAEQPLPEEALLSGPLEPTNQWYAVAKIAGLKLVEAAVEQFDVDWCVLMPTNLYGPGDNFSPMEAHVIPGMMRKFHEGREQLARGLRASVRLWGTGSALREFLHVDDLAAAVWLAARSGLRGMYNVGSDEEVTVGGLATRLAEVVGYDGPVEWDRSMPDGTPRKRLDSSRIRALGWEPRIQLSEGLRSTYAWFLDHRESLRG